MTHAENPSMHPQVRQNHRVDLPGGTETSGSLTPCWEDITLGRAAAAAANRPALGDALVAPYFPSHRGLTPESQMAGLGRTFRRILCQGQRSGVCPMFTTVLPRTSLLNGYHCGGQP